MQVSVLTIYTTARPNSPQFLIALRAPTARFGSVNSEDRHCVNSADDTCSEPSRRDGREAQRFNVGGAC